MQSILERSETNLVSNEWCHYLLQRIPWFGAVWYTILIPWMVEPMGRSIKFIQSTQRMICIYWGRVLMVVKYIMKHFALYGLISVARNKTETLPCFIGVIEVPLCFTVNFEIMMSCGTIDSHSLPSTRFHFCLFNRSYVTTLNKHAHSWTRDRHFSKESLIFATAQSDVLCC